MLSVRESVPRLTDNHCYRPGDIWITDPRARAIGTKSRDLTQAGGSFQDLDTSGRWPVAWRCVAWRRPDRRGCWTARYSAGSALLCLAPPGAMDNVAREVGLISRCRVGLASTNARCSTKSGSPGSVTPEGIHGGTTPLHRPPSRAAVPWPLTSFRAETIVRNGCLYHRQRHVIRAQRTWTPSLPPGVFRNRA
jgi:hypothetical protein